MEAISIVDNVANVELDRCIGCGLFTTTCQANAIQLVKKEKETVPPKNHDALYKQIMMERFGPWGCRTVSVKLYKFVKTPWILHNFVI